METLNPNSTPSGESNYKTIDERLKLARIGIDNALNVPELKAPLGAKGYDKPVLTAAIALLKKAEDLHAIQKDKYGDKFDATDGFDKLWEKLDDEYNDHSGLARIALKNNRGDLEKLQLNGKRKRTISGWLGQAKAFYTNALTSPEIIAALAKKGVTQTELLDMKTKIADLEKKEAVKFNSKGEAQNSTAERDKAIDDLLEWYKDFCDTAKIALRKTPLLLEKLGINSK